jgi:hypothetical protein
MLSGSRTMLDEVWAVLPDPRTHPVLADITGYREILDVLRETVHFELFVSGTSFSGTAAANFHDLAGGLLAGPLKAEMTGVRFTL